MKQFSGLAKHVSVFAVVVLGVLMADALSMTGQPSPRQTTRFNLHPNPKFLACITNPNDAEAPEAEVFVVQGELNDRLTLRLSHFKPGLAFDLFTVQRTNLLADGTVDPNFPRSFGLAWYESDVQVDDEGEGQATIRTILLNQIFGFDPDVSLPPTNTFHVGFWFNNPDDAAACGFTGFTPFVGQHHAGPLAMISVPDPATNLGPLCTNPDTLTAPPHAIHEGTHQVDERGQVENAQLKAKRYLSSLIPGKGSRTAAGYVVLAG
jgi:hypothetical protein